MPSYSSHTQPISFNQLVGYQFLFSNHIDLQPFCPGKPWWVKRKNGFWIPFISLIFQMPERANVVIREEHFDGIERVIWLFDMSKQINLHCINS